MAVLPFVNRSRDEDDEYFSDGLADELVNLLAKIRGLRVAARASSFQFKGKSEDLTDIGRKLKVATLLDGSVRKAGNRVRISVQLVKVEDGYPLWSETYDRTLEDIFAVQDDIAQSVVKELRSTLLGEEPDSKASGEVRAEVAAAARGRGTNAEAHRLVLQGRFLIERLSRQDVERGIELLRQALQLDPVYALAWAVLSRAYWAEGGYGWKPVSEASARAAQAARRSLELEPDLAEGHLALGMIRMLYEWDWQGADASLRRALELAPGDAAVLRVAGHLARTVGRMEEATALLRKAVEQDPLNPTGYSALGMTFRQAGRMKEAEAAYRRALEIAPERVATRMVLSLVLVAQGRVEEGLAEIAAEPEEWARLTALAAACHTAGRREESDRALRELSERSPADAAYQIAAVHAWRGETEEAFSWLERAYAQRDAGLADVRNEPSFDSLHQDPRWSEFLRRMGLVP